jgi:hypothetical protein
MIVRNIDYDFDISQTTNSESRSSGLHLGQVVNRYRELVEGNKRRSDPDEDSTKHLHFEKGFLWEDVFSSLWGNRMAGMVDSDRWVQQEFVQDGIYMTPDVVYPMDGFLDEYKATTRASYKFDALEEHFAPWLIQIKGYLRAAGMKRARLIVLFLCGDYRPPFPQVRAKELEFTNRELEENWDLVLRIAEDMR